MPKYSVIIPVYNRPEEVDELLESLTKQSYTDFEVLIVEDGSTRTCEKEVEKYQAQLSIRYFFKENTQQGFSRNYGFERANGDWLIVFDSDCIIPTHYFEAVDQHLTQNELDAYGGPDKADESFTLTQKAISYSMTSLFTTGGIRGNKRHVGPYHPRSFNMGIKKEVFEKTGGYIISQKGEDIEFSIRIIRNGFKTGLIEGAFVYHKRRTNFRQFFKQLHFFGTARINVFRFFREELKLVHFFPAVFFLGLVTSLILLMVWPTLGKIGLGLYGAYGLIILLDALIKSKNVWVSFLAVIAAFVQLIAYGIGFLKEGLTYLKSG